MNQRFLILVLVLAAGLAGCAGLRPSQGGGQTVFMPPRQIDRNDIAIAEGYFIEPVATGLNLPVCVTFDDQGQVYVVEAGYSYGELWQTPRLVRVEPTGQTVEIARGGGNGPWTGAVWQKGQFYLAEGGVREGGKILRISGDGRITPLVENLPTRGDHHTNGPVVDKDGTIYFATGTYTNSGVVGPDNAKMGWLPRFPSAHDIPGQDITLAGENYQSSNPLENSAMPPTVTTGAFVPFGTATTKGQVIRGQVPCNGGVFKIKPDGGTVELVAWGLRNPFWMAFNPDGKLYASDNGYDERGSRQVYGSADHLWEIRPGAWYGWPDFDGGRPLDSHYYEQEGKVRPKFLLAKHPGTPPKPVVSFAVHSGSHGFDFCRNPAFAPQGEVFMAQFGDMAAMVGKVLAPVGFKVVRADLKTGVIHDFAVNKGPLNGPASFLKAKGLERPVSVRFNLKGDALYVVDFGVMMVHKGVGAKPVPNTGVLWRITRSGGSH